MKNLKFVRLSVPVLILFLTLSLTSGRKINLNLRQHHLDPVATHNMLVVGEKAVFLSHLPMFQEKGEPLMPHRYQVILEVEFTKKDSNPQDDYTRDRQDHQNIKIYTINPEPFVLPTLVSSDLQQDSLRKFKGTIFRGHLEKGGSSILKNVDVNVKHVVYFKKFDPEGNKTSELEYLIFGKGKELFLAHLIAGPPDFDQVLSITTGTGHTFIDEALAKGIKVIFPGTINSSSTRLQEKQHVEGSVNIDSTSALQKIQIEINREFYFEEGELQVPPNFETTAEERKASFQ